MNREIKFRAWHKDAEKMADVTSFSNMDYKDKNDYKYVVTTLKVKNDDVCWKYRNIILMQYTGLKDKNGVEIYEGDILKTTKGMRVVTYDLGCFYVKLGSSKYRVGGWDTYSIEVIGNIYEHENLIK